MARARERGGFATVELCQLAVSDRKGSGWLMIPDAFDRNDGIARLGEPDGGPSCGTPIEVTTAPLDSLCVTGRLALIKLDIEGHEWVVVRNSEMIRRRKVSHLIYEDHSGGTSELAEFFRASGYTIFQLGWRLGGPVLAPCHSLRICRDYEPPSFLATLDPAGATARFNRRGWRVLRRLRPRR